MNEMLLRQIEQLNPWLTKNVPTFDLPLFIPRIQIEKLLLPSWDKLGTILIGPRRAGKTTLGLYLCQQLIAQKRFHQLIYLNCDYVAIREWLNNPLFVTELMEHLELNIQSARPIFFIDEVQRLQNPGLLLKAIIDLNWPIKIMASGSSQLEMKSKVQEHLTGRQFSALVLPLSFLEWQKQYSLDHCLLYGAYPQIIHEKETQVKKLILGQLYQDYISKDIVEILQVGRVDILQKLILLLAHSTGQLINYNALATDCQVSVVMIKHYISILEQTYVIASIRPFVGNKRSEITSNPIIYFIDNGFRNYALSNFHDLSVRVDAGFLVENFIFQELFKYQVQHFLHFTLHYWRTKSGAEVDFVLVRSPEEILPIEVKYRSLKKASISRSFRSFLQAYQPAIGIIITKDFLDVETFEGCRVHFISLGRLSRLFNIISNDWNKTIETALPMHVPPE